jgi:hypothetical protein
MDINKYFDKIFYINLEKDVDRKNNLLSQFNKFGITNFERFDAIIFTEIPEKKYASITFSGLLGEEKIQNNIQMMIKIRFFFSSLN